MKFLKFLIIFTVILIAFACEEKSKKIVDVGTVPEVVSITTVPNWNLNSAAPYKIEAQVSDPQGPADIASVRIFVLNVAGGDTVAVDSLFDDGSFYHPGSGDVLARDGVFTNRFLPVEINPGLSEVSLEVIVQATDNDGNKTPEKSQIIYLSENARPLIKSVSAPDSVKSGDSRLKIEVIFADDDGIADVTACRIDIFEEDGVNILFTENLFNDGNAALNGDLFKNDSIFTGMYDSSFAAGKQGNYRMQFYVTDSFNESNEIVPNRFVLFENQPGKILETFVPDTLTRPAHPDSFKILQLNARVTDPQGLADVDSVYFLSQKPDGSFSGNGFRYELKDNGDGLFGDEQAGDGIFSVIIKIAGANDPGVYTFHFYMRDKVGQQTTVMLDSVRVF